MFIRTNVDTLVRLSGAMSNEGTRFYLCGVHIRKRPGLTGVIVEATNGHIAAIEHDAEGDCSGNAIVGDEIIKVIAKAADKLVKAWKVTRADLIVFLHEVATTAGRRSHYVITVGEQSSGEVTLGYPDNIAFVDGTFPDIDCVVPHHAPDTLPATNDAYNAELVATLARTARSEKATRNMIVPYRAAVLYSGGIGHPALMRVSGAPNWLGVIMPCRVDCDSTGPAPEWFFGKPTALKAVA